MEFDCVPGIASPNAYSKAEMRELIAHAKQRGVEIIPELASLGQCVYLTRLPQYQHLNETDEVFTGMCPVAPETRPLLKALIEETATVFDGPNVHVGLDEANIGQHPLTKLAPRTRTKGDLFSNHINFIHGVVAVCETVLQASPMRRAPPRMPRPMALRARPPRGEDAGLGRRGAGRRQYQGGRDPKIDALQRRRRAAAGTAQVASVAFMDRVREEMHRQLFGVPDRAIQIVPAAVRTSAVAWGAAIAAFDENLSDRRLLGTAN